MAKQKKVDFTLVNSLLGEAEKTLEDDTRVTADVDGDLTVGLKKDGSVLACGSNVNGQCDVSDLEEKAVSISCGRYHTAILLESGKVLIKGDIQLNGDTITQDVFGNKIDLNEVSEAIKKAFPLRGEMRVNCNHRNWQLQNERIE